MTEEGRWLLLSPSEQERLSEDWYAKDHGGIDLLQ